MNENEAVCKKRGVLGGWRHNGLLYGGVGTASCEGREKGSVTMGKLETH